LALLAVVGAAIAAFFLLTETGSANTLEVGPGGYATIGAAVQAASPGDTISVHAGTYREQVNLSGKAVTVQPYGDGTVTVDGQCQREYGFYIGSGTGQAIKGLTVTNTTGASVFMENSGSPKPANITIDGNTLQNFDCTWSSQDPASWGQFRGGVAAWYTGSGMRITNNTIRHRTSGEVRGSTDGIWFKSNDNNPSGGGHYIAGNTIIGGWDGIGGEEEGSPHGTFDKDTVVENNTVQDTWDDCIQVEGGDQNVRVRNNDLSGCGTGIAFAAPMSGPLYLENNTIHDLVTGLYANHVCYKTGTNGSSSAVTYMTGNSCDVRGGQEANGIHQSGGDNMTPIVSRNNSYHVEGYVYYIGDSRGQDFDYDCMVKANVVTDNFAKWSGSYYQTLAAFQAGTGQETHASCGAGTPTPTPTRTSSPTPTRTPTRTPTPTPTRTPSPTPTLTPGHTPGPLPTPTTGAPGASTPDESPLISAAMAPGWNFECYVGNSRPTKEALAAAAGRVSAVYRLGDGGVFDRWFPNLPEVSTLTTVNPGDALFLLTSDPFLWAQSVSNADSAVDLDQGWNAVCYSGGSGSVEAVTRGIDLPYTVIYTLAPDRSWQRFVPGKPEVCSLSELARFTPLLILVTGGNGHWAFSP
jgi:hypothetical protein